ncbi:hypothetical protein ACOI1H_19155 [Loktanella sp. DJP18]|uniref:hypothetical protein n=1 Tax=Loktanella sp. DJP18 TaxID=3409788 RepID=UPI003BB7ACE9
MTFFRITTLMTLLAFASLASLPVAAQDGPDQVWTLTVSRELMVEDPNMRGMGVFYTTGVAITAQPLAMTVEACQTTANGILDALANEEIRTVVLCANADTGEVQSISRDN